MKKDPLPLVVVGAGAAGLLTAIRAAERGIPVLLLEKTPRVGTKILMSGGTRCNLTQATDVRGIVRAFGRQGKFLHAALAAFSPQDVVRLVEAEGVATKVEPSGKIFPVSNRAADVVAALMARLSRAGVALSLKEPLLEVERVGDGFRLTTSQRSLTCRQLVVTTGGKSYPGCGTTGDGYPWLERMGHTIVPPRPALTPITSDDAWVRQLQGLTIPDVRVQVVDETASGKDRLLAEARGSFLFTHFGLSGPSVLDVSRSVTGHPRPRELRLVCDFSPGMPQTEWLQQLGGRLRAEGKRQVAGVLAEAQPRRFVEAILACADVDASTRGAELSKGALRALTEATRAASIRISGSRGYQKAEVTAGGVALTEVDFKTMQSRLVPGLFLAGEILDLDGPIGGYNFQAAFSTAWLAGGSVG